MSEMGAREVVVGSDFRFGAGGKADVALLQRVGPQLGFGVDIVEPVMVEGERVSSSAIRVALASGDLEHAARLLGRPYAMHGKVIRGEGLGRKLGFPTANMRVHRRVTPLDGIFAVRVRGIDAQPLPGVASLGTRPDDRRTRSAARGARVRFRCRTSTGAGSRGVRKRLREERKFETLPDMVVQMHDDARQAKTALGIST